MSTNNRNKKSDNPSDVILSTKRPAQADINELFLDRTQNKLPRIKRGIGQFFDLVSKTITDALDTRVTALEQNPGGGSEYTETIVNISSAQILNMGTSPIELLPAAGVGKYYDYYGFIEFNGGVTGYTITDDIVVGSVGKYGGSYLSSNLIIGTEDIIMGFSNRGGGQGNGVNIGVVVSFEQSLNEAISLFTYNGTNPTLGNGTLTVKIYHKTITFGA